MIVTTLFQLEGKFERVQVELKLLAGIPQMHIVGLPDASLRECGVKVKSALKSRGLEWPPGYQVIVNLRPALPKKSSLGADLAIVLGFLALTEQLPASLKHVVMSSIIYGEIGLDGRVFAPRDVSRALLEVAPLKLLTGPIETEVRQGEWTEISTVDDAKPRRRSQVFNWDGFWQPPQLPEISLSSDAADALMLAAHAKLSVLVAGPPGSGKTTWARALYAMSAKPSSRQRLELARLIGERAWDSRWRPLEQPHHTTSPLAMVGGGVPLRAGVISRAHGGVLLLDEFLEFDSRVQEALREPMENGVIELARGGLRERWPCEFQCVATTNLCPCGQMVPGFNKSCGFNLSRCQSVWRRLSGPVVDRFDILVYTDRWLKSEPGRLTLAEIKTRLREAAMFARGPRETIKGLPSDFEGLNLSHRRRRALLRIARTLADFEASPRVRHRHFVEAAGWALDPMDSLRQLFA